MNTLRYIIISILSGLTAIIPGVSGGTIFAIFGISEKLASDINDLTAALVQNIFSSFKGLVSGIKNYGKLPIIIGLGSLFTSILFANLVVEIGTYIEFFLRFLFVGMVVFSLPTLWSETNSENKRQKFKYIYAIIGFLIAYFLFKNDNSLIEGNLDNYSSLLFNIKFFIISFIAGITTILPGISGTNIIILGGVYTDYILFSSNILEFWPQYTVFLIGTVLGTIVAASVIGLLLRKYRCEFFSLMTGLTASTIIVIWSNPLSSVANSIQALFGIVIAFVLIKTLKNQERIATAK